MTTLSVTMYIYMSTQEFYLEAVEHRYFPCTPEADFLSIKYLKCRENSSEIVETSLIPPTEEPPIIDNPLSLSVYIPFPYGEVPL